MRRLITSRSTELDSISWNFALNSATVPTVGQPSIAQGTYNCYLITLP